MAIALHAKLEGVDASLEKLKAVDRSMSRRIIRKGVRAACMLAARRGRSDVPKGASGLLRKALGYKMAPARRSRATAVGVVGPRRGFKRWIKGKGNVDPVRYGHLTEGGTKPHRIKSSAKLPFSVAGVQAVKRLAFISGGRLRVVASVAHPGTRAQRWLHRIQTGNQSGMATAFSAKVESELLREAAKKKPSEVDDGQ